MTISRYSEYRRSGVDWLGDLPAHWSVVPLKRISEVRLGKMLQNEASSESDEAKPYLRAANIQWSGVDTSDIKSMWVSPRERTHLRLRVGDLLVSEGGDVGRSCIWQAELPECYFQNSVNRVRSLGEADTKYLYYWMSAIKSKGFIDVICNKSTIAHFTAEKVAEVPTPLPPLQEQLAIAAFLDRETAKIEALIAEQERLLALLAEKRQAVISHAVTKGINPNAPMKDSGVAWLGAVPVHWSVKALKHIVSTPITDGPHETPEFLDEGVPFVSAEAVSGGVIDFEKIRGYISVEDHERYSQKYKPMLLDIYLVKSGATTGVTAMVETDAEFNIWSPLAAIRCDRSVANPYFVLSALRSRNFQEGIALNWSFGTQQNIGMGVLGDLPMALPPLPEQEAIAQMIGGLVPGIEALCAEVRRAIGLLKERRSVLIAAAVTGQLDVREAA